MGETATLSTLAQFAAAAVDAVAGGHIQAKVAGTAAVVDTLNVIGAARAALEVIVGLVVAVAVMVALGLPVAAAAVAGPTITVAVVASGFSAKVQMARLVVRLAAAAQEVTQVTRLLARA